MTGFREIIRAGLSPEQKAAADWIYEATKNPAVAVLLLGAASGVAVREPDWTYWQIMVEAVDSIKESQILISLTS